MALSLQCNPELGWEKIVNQAQNHWKEKFLKAAMCKLGLGATVYHIWKHSNAVLHKDSISSEEQIVAAIRKQVKAREEFKGSFLVSH